MLLGRQLVLIQQLYVVACNLGVADAQVRPGIPNHTNHTNHSPTPNRDHRR